MKKPIGVCPFCEERTRANVIDSNTLRRDKCKCEKCNEYIYVCRTPACHNYAKGGAIYDDEFCPSCIKNFPSVAVAIVGFMASVKALTSK